MFDFLQSFLSHPSYKLVAVSSIALFIYLSLIVFFQKVYPKKNISYLVLLLGFSILPLISILRPGSYESGDLTFHVARLMDFYKSLQEGILIPRWAGNLNATYGYPLFIFIYPLPYYFASAFHFVGFNFLDSMKLLLIFTYIGSGITMFSWLKRHVSERNAFLGSILYLFAPYHLVDLHFRADVGEMAALIFLPLSFLLLDKTLTRDSFVWKFLAASSLCLLVLSHPAISLLGFPLLTAYILFMQPDKRLTTYLKTLFPFFLALALSAFYWVPVIFEGKYTIGSLFTPRVLQYPKLSELLFSTWRYGLLFQGPQGQLSFALGYAHWIIVIFALFLLIFKRPRNKVLVFSVLMFAVYFFLIQGISKPIWDSISALRRILLTYRLLTILVLLSSVAGAFANELLKSKFLFYLLLTVAIGTTILNWGNRKNVPEITDTKIQKELPLISVNGECFWPALFVANPGGIVCRNTVPSQSIQSDKANLKIFSEIRLVNSHYYKVVLEKDSIIAENTSYFPGWQLSVDDKNEPINFKTQKYPGLIAFNLEKGVHTLKLDFKDTTLRFTAFLLSFVAFFVSGTILIISGLMAILTKALPTSASPSAKTSTRKTSRKS